MSEYLEEVVLKLGEPVVTLLEDAADGGRFDRQKLRDFAQRITEDRPNKVVMRHKVRMEENAVGPQRKCRIQKKFSIFTGFLSFQTQNG